MLGYIFPFVQRPSPTRGGFAGSDDRATFALALAGGGTFAYLLLLGTLYGKKRGTPEYWLKRGWKAGRRGKDWKKPMKACVRTMSVANEGPMLPTEAIEWCGSIVATGHAAGKEGAPFKRVALPALSGSHVAREAARYGGSERFPRKRTADVDRFLKARADLLSGKVKGQKAKKLDREMCELYHKMSDAEHYEIIGQSCEGGKGPWEHVAGGCLVGGAAAACGQQPPCDDQFQNKKLGVEASFSVPIHWHFGMLGKVKDLKTLERLPGVKLHKKYSIAELGGFGAAAPRLSKAQLKALRRAASTAAPFRGHQRRTLESLAKLGLITYTPKLEKVQGRTRWKIWAEVTPEGRRVLETS
jgi:hypothetical protein